MPNTPPVLFLNIGWARAYDGARDDIPRGNFAYLQEGNTAVGEHLNFKAFGGKCYGYSPVKNGTINIGNLGAASDDDEIGGVLVIWTATNPDQGGRYIVGWWHNATVYRSIRQIRPAKNRPDCVTVASAKDCHLLKPDDRTYSIPARVKGWPGIASAFFASATLSPADLDPIVAYVSGNRPVSDDRKSAKSTKGRAVVDPIRRAEIEKNAILAVCRHYEDLRSGWSVISVEAENVGWDLEARSGKRLLRIEVKGRAEDGSVELTPNEYRAMTDKKTKLSYRLAIVHFALRKEPSVRIFAFSSLSGSWIDDAGAGLKVREMTGAIASIAA